MAATQPVEPGLDLRRQLEQLTATYAARTTPEAAAIMASATEELLAGGMLEGSLHEGDQAPDFTLPDPTGRPFRLADARARGPVVVTFYRGAW
jgi:AhpC/TSA family protein